MEGKPRAWTDLQLPLYREALCADFPAGAGFGYFALPKAVGETGILLWDDYTPELHLSAMECVRGICVAIRAGEFGPPNERIRRDADDFASLFHHGVANSVFIPGVLS